MRHAHRAGLRTTATMMYGTVETDEERLEHLLRLRDAAGRDRRLHRVHHLELSARSHRARRHRSDRRRLPAHARARAHRARQLRQPAGVVGDAGRQGRAAEPGVRRQRHGQRDDRGERRPRRRRQLLHGRSRDRPQHRGRRLRRRSAATCTTRSSAIRSSASARCRACWSWRPRATTATPRCPRSCELSGAQPRRQAAPRHPDVDPLPRRLDRSDRRAADPRRLGRRRSRAHRRACRQRDRRRRRAASVDLGDVAVLPGLVNAHTHLELSYLRDEVPPASQFVTWIRGVMAARRRQPDPKAPEILDGDRPRRSTKRVACGTAIVGDISNTLVTFEPLARSPLAGVVFYELIRFNAPDPAAFVDAGAPADRRAGADATACGRASRRTRRTRSRRWCSARFAQAIDRDPFAPCSVHLAESAEEVEFIRTGGGPWRALLEELGVVGSGVDAAGRHAGAVSRRQRLPRRARARRPRRADDARRSRSVWRRAARRSSPARAATATPAPARRRSRTSTPPACASRSAPTAWPARRI